MKKFICAVLMGFSIFWIIGVAGSLECDKISLAQAVVREIPALVILYVSFWIGGFSK